MSAPAILSQITGDSARARLTDPETSHAAADSISAEALEESEAEVLDILAEAMHPLTDRQIERDHFDRVWQGAAARKWEPSRLRTARKQLVASGRVVQDGVGRTPSGREAAAWRLAVPL